MTRFLILATCGMALLAAQEREPSDPLFRAEARLVQAHVAVFDERGNPLSSIPAAQFRVFDDGEPQQLVAFEAVEDRLTCAILLDTTASMEAFLPSLKYAAVKFIDDFREGETIAVYAFSERVRRAQDFTSDRKLAKQAVMRTRAEGSTALFDSIANVSRDIAARKGKKALVVFTDGADNSSSISVANSIAQAKRSGVPIYAIAQGIALKDAELLKSLDQLAAGTGGLAFELKNPAKVTEVFAKITENLQHTYLLSWKVPGNAGTAWRPIKVSIAGMDRVRIRLREGYWPD